MKRKLWMIPLLVALVIVSTVSALASEGTNNSGVTVTSVTAAPGEEITMLVSVRSMMADNIGILLNYDKEVLSPALDAEGKHKSGWLIDADETVSDYYAEKGIAVWGSPEKIIEGPIFKLVFVIAENTPVGTKVSVNCTVSAMLGEDPTLSGAGTGTVHATTFGTVSGTVQSYGDENASVTVQLLDDTNAVVDTRVLENGETDYEFNAPVGNYTLRFSKTKHCPRDYAIVLIDTEAQVANAEVVLYGDVNKDGEIRTADATQILRYYAEKSSGISTEDEYIQKVADVNRDGKIRAADAAQILRYYAEKSSVFDQLD